MKWKQNPIKLYKVVRPNWLDETELVSFEVLHHAHTLGYVPGRKVTTIEPAFFFLSRVQAVRYLAQWMQESYAFACDGEIWQCEAETIYKSPSHVPPSNAIDMFDIFWRMYYCSKTEDTRELFEGLEPVPHGTVMSFTFSVERQVTLPVDIHTLAAHTNGEAHAE